MSILTDRDIIAEVAKSHMIDPFVPKQIREVNGKKVISYGLSSSGLDIRIGTEWKKPIDEAVLDPKNPKESQWYLRGLPNKAMFSNGPQPNTEFAQDSRGIDSPPAPNK